MKVVFLQDVEGTARIGEIKEVKNGFARNYLLPRGLAAPATPDVIRRAQARAEREAKRQAALDAEARNVAAKLEGVTLTITARAGEQGKLYGSVTAADIAEAAAKVAGTEVDRHQILLAEPIKELGTYTVTYRLTRNVSVDLTIEVVGEGGERAPAKADASASGQTETAEGEPETSS